MMEIKPDRHNWRQFCQESELVDEEWADWRRMAREMQQDDTLFDFIGEATQKERQAKQAAESARAWSWGGLIVEADARRRLMRAEMKAWREYHAEKVAAPTRV